MSLIASVESLRRVAASDGGHAHERLARVRALLGEDIAHVDRELARLTREGVSPATDSAAHLLEAGGKRVRPLTVLLSSACFGIPPRVARDVAVVAELVHLATLLHDDVIDDGRERRGQPTSRRIWGNAVSVLAGDLLLTHALELTASAAPPDVLGGLFATLRRLVEGEIVQLRGRFELDASEDAYFRVVLDKTASLFEWAARSGAACSGASQTESTALGHFGAHVGVAFQLVDDVLDYAGEPALTGKAVLADALEGKLTLPLIRALAAGSVRTTDVEDLRSGNLDAAQRVAEGVRDSGVCSGIRALAVLETERALESLEVVPPGAARDMLSWIALDLEARVS